MELETRESANALCLAPKGEILWNNCNELKDAVSQKMQAEPKRFQTVYILLKEVSMVDSTGLGVFMAIKATCQRYGTQVILVEPSPELHPFLVSINLNVLFEIINLADAANRDALLFG